jgi:adenylate cyclase
MSPSDSPATRMASTTPDLLGIPDVNDDFDAARAALVEWYVNEAWRLTHPHSLVRETCRRLNAAGVPIYVFNAWVMTLHPNYFGVVHAWEQGSDEITTRVGSHENWNTPTVQNTPLAAVRDDGASAIRRKLCDPAWPMDYPVLQEYAENGATDYVAMRLPASGKSFYMISTATRQPGGFTTAELALIDALTPYMARLTDIQALRYLSTTLLETYVGTDAGHRIMVGNIRRGSVETIRAVIWLCDMRDFTRLSDTLPGEKLVALLNDYFDCVGPPVRERGGEILKFIGDAMLAIFRFDDDAARTAACENALAAARDAVARIDELNASRKDAAEKRIDVGIALHLGDVMYGNIGAADRLDFTVIGPAVNLAARIEDLCRPLGERVLMSEAFAKASGGAHKALGAHELKGLEMAQMVYAPTMPDNTP